MRFNPVSLVPACSVNVGMNGRMVEWMDELRWSGGAPGNRVGKGVPVWNRWLRIRRDGAD